LLERKKFVGCDPRGQQSRSHLATDEKGIDFLHDNGLVEDWMHGVA
jgi:hypothetical protein